MEPIRIEDLYRERGQIHRLACALVGESDADDVVQEAMAAALARETPPQHWGRWLSGVTRHISWRRSSERRTQRRRLERHAEDERWAEAHASSPEELVAEVEAKNALERAVLRLEEPYRSVLLWRYYEDLSIEEISRRAGTPPSTTRTRIARGLERLRARMSSEQGPEWRTALAPLLLRRPAETTFSGAAAATGVTLMTVSILKWTAVATSAAALLVFLPQLLNAGADPERAAEHTLSREALVDAQVDTPAPEPPREESLAREATSPAVPATSDAEPAPAAGPGAQLVDAESGIALGGVTLSAWTYHTTGALFFKRTKEYRETVRTDADGRFALPGPDADKSHAAPGDAFAEVLVQQEGSSTVNCTVTEGEDGTLVFAPNVAFACRVRLPGALTAAQREAVSFRLSVAESELIGEGIRFRMRPAATLENELLLLVPNAAMPRRWEDGKSVGTVTIATTSHGPAFTATFDSLPSLNDAPLEAQVSSTVIHSFQVLDATSGEPVDKADVTVFPASAQTPWSALGVHGRTDADGTVELMGVPSGAAGAIVQKHGYERQRYELAAVAGGMTELPLKPEAGLRTVEITVRSEQGSPPNIVWCVVDGTDGMTVARETAMPERENDGWVARLTMETVPSERCFVRLEGSGGAYSLERFWFLEPDQERLELDVGRARKMALVFVDAPEGVPYVYRQGIGSARHSVSDHEGSAHVRGAPVDGTPVTWAIQPRGHVPIIGTEADWDRSVQGGRETATIRADFEPGWGQVVFVYRLAPSDDGRGGELPYSLRAKLPVEGVTLLDGPTGRTLGVTDGRGLAVIAADERPEAIWYRIAGKTHRRPILEGETSIEIGL